MSSQAMMSSPQTTENSPAPQRNVLHFRKGSPVRSMRWHPLVWEKLYDLEVTHKHQVKVNRIAQVAVELGLTFLMPLNYEVRERILGVKGTKPFTFEQQEKIRGDVKRVLERHGHAALQSPTATRLTAAEKLALRDLAKKHGTTMSAIARQALQKIIATEAT